MFCLETILVWCILVGISWCIGSETSKYLHNIYLRWRNVETDISPHDPHWGQIVYIFLTFNRLQFYQLIVLYRQLQVMMIHMFFYCIFLYTESMHLMFSDQWVFTSVTNPSLFYFCSPPTEQSCSSLQMKILFRVNSALVHKNLGTVESQYWMSGWEERGGCRQCRVRTKTWFLLPLIRRGNTRVSTF